MSDIVISVEGLSKSYLVGHEMAGAAGYQTLRESMTRSVRRLARSALDMTRGNQIIQGDEVEEFWALKDVSFDVKRGEVIGVVGRNGAGKSTLLKILSRITEPTQGRVRIRGRVASLLEVGTGFHPELTGRENIFLNGAILGMTRREIKAKFDEIVDFAEVDRFLDTPVKRYSSGMYVRLAFAVAAHLEPEILVVDEVLAVGDLPFQKKCLGKMQDVAKGGRTVIFVSHQLSALSTLCEKSLLLSQGRLIESGPTTDVLQTYLNQNLTESGQISWPDKAAPGSDIVRLKAVRVLVDGQVVTDVPLSSAVMLEMEYEVLKAGTMLTQSFHLLNQLGECILATSNMPSACEAVRNLSTGLHPVGRFLSRCQLPANFLNDRPYRISAFIVANNSTLEAVAAECLAFRAYDDGRMRREYNGTWIGMVRPLLSWDNAALEQESVI